MENKGQGKPKVIYLAEAVIIAVVLTGLLLLLSAYLMLKAGISGGAVSAIMVVADCLPVFAAGFFLGKKVEEKRFVWGLVAAVICFALYLLLALLYDESMALSIGGYIKTFILMAAGGMLGGMLS